MGNTKISGFISVCGVGYGMGRMGDKGGLVVSCKLQ